MSSVKLDLLNGLGLELFEGLPLTFNSSHVRSDLYVIFGRLFQRLSKLILVERVLCNWLYQSSILFYHLIVYCHPMGNIFTRSRWWYHSTVKLHSAPCLSETDIFRNHKMCGVFDIFNAFNHYTIFSKPFQLLLFSFVVSGELLEFSELLGLIID